MYGRAACAAHRHPVSVSSDPRYGKLLVYRGQLEDLRYVYHIMIFHKTTYAAAVWRDKKRDLKGPFVCEGEVTSGCDHDVVQQCDVHLQRSVPEALCHLDVKRRRTNIA